MTRSLVLSSPQLRLRGLLGRGVIYLVLGAGAMLCLFPFIWMILTALKTPTEVAQGIFWPDSPQWGNFTEAWHAAEWTPYVNASGRWAPGYFLNSLIITVSTMVGVLFTSILAAYAFARLRVPGKNAIFFAFLATMMIPGEVTVIPNFILISQLGWVNTYFGLIMPWTASAFYIFLLRQFFRNIPDELYDAAVLDGCGHFRFLLTIVLPLSRAPLAIVALLSFIGGWNAFLWPLIVAQSKDLYPIQVGLKTFVTEMGSEVHLMMAAATFVIAPIVIFYFFTQKQFTEGIATTGVKG